MRHAARSIRSFIGSKDFGISKKFYHRLGFSEVAISSTMSYFHTGDIGFYLQDYYVKQWVNNSMLFLEVDDVQRYFDEVAALQLDKEFMGVKMSDIKYNDWGSEFFLHDPAGNLWHFGNFK